MAFDITPNRPLAKIFTLDMIVTEVSQYLKVETQQDLNPEFVKTLANIVIMDTAEFLSGAGSDDYGKKETISDQSSSVVDAGVAGTYTDSTRTIQKTTHGLTSANIGNRIFCSNSGDDKYMISEIESITDANNFVTKHSMGIDASIIYYVFPPFSAAYYDISPLRIASIVKIVDSVNGEIIKSGDIQFDNLSRFPEKQAKIWWYKHGQYIFFYVGTNVVSLGSWTLSYNSYPQLFTDDASLVDIRDNYVPLVIAQLKNVCREHLQMGVSDELNSLVDKKKAEIRENIRREKQVIDEKNIKKSIN